MNSDRVFVVTAEGPLRDPLGWALAHPEVIGSGFQAIARGVSLRTGREIPALGIDDTGCPTVMSAVAEGCDEEIGRLAAIIGFLRRHGEWLAATFPQYRWRHSAAPKLVVLASKYAADFLDAADGLAASELVLLRIRSLVAEDGSRLVLVERERAEVSAPAPSADPSDLNPDEQAFFQVLDAERRTLRGG